MSSILAFVEDPGASNYLGALVPALLKADCSVDVLASAAGLARLLQDGLAVREPAPGEDAISVMDRHRPSLVVVGTSENPDTLGLHLVAEARRRGIKSVGLVDGAANSEWRFAGRGGTPLAFAPDWIFVPDEGVRRHYVALGMPADRVVVAGHPHYDQVLEGRRQLQARDRGEIRRELFPEAGGRRIVTFIAEISTGLDPRQYLKDASYTLTGRGNSLKRTDIVIEEIQDVLAAATPRPFIVLRLHPKNTRDEFSAYLGEFDAVSQSEKAWDVVHASDLVLGMTSHLLLEAAILGCPTLSVVPRLKERDWLPTIGSGLTPCATTREEVRRHLRSLLSAAYSPVPESSLARGFRFGAIGRASKLLANLAGGTTSAGIERNLIEV